MKKSILTIFLTIIMIIFMETIVFASSWQEDAVGWWWQREDGSYPINGWKWIDGNQDGIAECYYFNENGYCLQNSITPDGYYVNVDGAWCVNGIVQTMVLKNTNKKEKEEEFGENMAQVTINGERITFYLEETATASDGAESMYMSFQEDGSPQYRLYLRLALNVKAGTVFQNNSGKACYISLHTKYDEKTGKWTDSYTASFSKRPEEYGSYEITIDYGTLFEEKQQSGRFEATLLGSKYSTAAVQGKKLDLTDGIFYYKKHTSHENVQIWKNQNNIGTRQIDNREVNEALDDSDIINTKNVKILCSTCNGTGKWTCTSCDGAGKILQQKDSINLGSGSKSYTVKVNCKSCLGSGFLDCIHCMGKGYIE